MDYRMKSMAVIAMAAFIYPILGASQCNAGAWTRESGKLYERFAFNYYFADSEFHMDQVKSNFKKFRDMNIGNYFEYGLTDRITFINSLYYKFLEKEDEYNELNSNGLGDVDLAVKAKLAEGSWGVVSTQALVKIPGAYDENDDLPLGNAQYDFELRLLYGRSLWPYIPGYCNVEVAHRWRLDDPSDEFRYLVEFGMDFTQDLYGRIKLDAILSMDNGSRFNTSGNPMATNNFDLGKLDLALGYKITKSWGVELGCTPEIYGRNTTRGTTYTLAVTYQIQ